MGRWTAGELLERARAEFAPDPAANRAVPLVERGEAPLELLRALALEERAVVAADRRAFLRLAERAAGMPRCAAYYAELARGEEVAAARLEDFARAVGAVGGSGGDGVSGLGGGNGGGDGSGGSGSRWGRGGARDGREGGVGPGPGSGAGAHARRADRTGDGDGDGDALRPGCQAYPAFVAWLALNAAPAGTVLALAANFAAWGGYCGRIATGLREHYGLDDRACAFFDLFAAPSPEHERTVLAAVQEWAEAGRIDEAAVRRHGRLLRAYEAGFWDALVDG
ncbi:transcriptional regulator [Streptomyces sp. NPDC047130]|uniref:transcriptional regulator n=1 Tax=Streptomyces sp. NPDC047130 TaxID=3155261 RepID=UPI0033CB556B